MFAEKEKLGMTGGDKTEKPFEAGCEMAWCLSRAHQGQRDTTAQGR